LIVELFELSTIINMLKLVRTTSQNEDFYALTTLLDAELRVMDGEDNAFYAQFNKIANLRHAVVAYLNDRAVGCGAFKAVEGCAEIKRMYVSPEHRGQQIAGAVLAELETWAAELDFPACILETGKKQPFAIRLYEKSGYVRIPNYGQYQGVENSVCMKKLLGSPGTESQSF
jgi:putative acetyltransferase